MDDPISLAVDEFGEDRGRRLLEIVDELGVRAALRAFERECSVRFSAQLWSQHVDRKAIVTRLQQRYGYKERKAYMIADEGLTRFAKRRGEFAKARGNIELGQIGIDNDEQ